MRKITFAAFLLLFSNSLLAETPALYTKTFAAKMDVVYSAVYDALEAKKFWVVFEPDMGSRMARMAGKWGDDYNRNDLTGVKSMVFCNIDWTHKMANADPVLLALCPLHVTLYSQQGKTTVTFIRPSVVAKGSAGEEEALILEKKLQDIIEGAL